VSVEEIGREGTYSGSIHSQMEMGEEYIGGQQDVVLACFYQEDGASGSNYNRPEFRRMLADIELGKINMVIVKDISRLGREQIDTNYYLGKYFPERKVRVVSLLDQYDSLESMYDELMDIKILMHDLYVRDTSEKIKAVICAKRSMGEYTAKEPPYGYIKSATVHNHLEIDPYAAAVVKGIYKMYLSGFGYTAIARALNEDRVLCPSRYKKEVLKMDYPYSTGKGVWTKSAVRDILQNAVYMGAVILRKMEKPTYKLHYRRQIPVGERVLCENAHEAIISKEEFERVQKQRMETGNICFGKGAEPHKYADMLFCGKCGYAMQKRYLSSIRGYDGYMCGAHKTVGRAYCALNYIQFEKLDELVASTINLQIKAVILRWEKLNAVLKKNGYIFTKKCTEIRQRIEKNKKYRKQAYEQFMDGTLSREVYLERKFLYEKEMARYECEYARLRQEAEKREQSVDAMSKFLEKARCGEIAKEQLERDFLRELIGKIFVYPERQIEILFRFKDPLREEG